MFPEWHHAVPESLYFKVGLPETLKTFRMYSISRFVYVLHWLETRLIDVTLPVDIRRDFTSQIRNNTNTADNVLETEYFTDNYVDNWGRGGRVG